MKRILLLALPAFALIACASKTPKQDDVFATYVNSYIHAHNIPGASFAASRHGKIEYSKGFGFADVENKVPATEQTVFRIASVSKPITAVAMFKVLEEKNMNIEDALNKPVFGPKGYLPEYKNIKDKRALKVTLRDLLQHTSGLHPEDDPQYETYKIAKKLHVKSPASAKDIIRYVLKYQKLDLEPGKEYHYSNFGYNVLARVIENVSGEKYEAYVQKHLFAPIGITDMAIAGNTLKDRRADEAKYYDDPRHPDITSALDGKTVGPMAYNGFSFHTMDGHGGWLGTASDLVKFLNAVTPGSGAPQLLKPETIRIMTKPVSNIGNPTASMGFVSAEDGKVISHAGALETGTLTYYIRRADGSSWAVLFNRLPVEKIDQIKDVMMEFADNINRIYPVETK
ncbi:serine hydrolase [Bdellovibrio sp. NC01]|uniref:serine hydrolase domain-containing protein n=1 Tax=Bdellovibrio sp. NC01 TaxID=2220073 RepID=UPI00143DBCEE|nr:serine hydrolase domain-containing protein [Bdellovibrio sp. NC01]